jgi:hypothetical protein
VNAGGPAAWRGQRFGGPGRRDPVRRKCVKQLEPVQLNLAGHPDNGQFPVLVPEETNTFTNSGKSS